MEGKRALTWAERYLASQKMVIVDSHSIVETSYSIVYIIKTMDSVVYLKVIPASLFYEAKVLKFLHEQRCCHIPKLIAENNDLNCFLTQPCGDESLRHLFDSAVDLKMLSKGISNYTAIQRSQEKNVQSLLKMGAPDWRLEKFPSLYQKLIQQQALLIGDGLTAKEIEQLHYHCSTCEKLCADLASYDIPETINHCDFQYNNMLLDKQTGEINIIDWGETVITHPFFSLNGCLWNLTYFDALTLNDPEYLALKSQSIVPWLDDFEETTLLKAFDIANQLLGIAAALEYQRLYFATFNQAKTVQQQHPGSIAGCLRTFLGSVAA